GRGSRVGPEAIRVFAARRAACFVRLQAPPPAAATPARGPQPRRPAAPVGRAPLSPPRSIRLAPPVRSQELAARLRARPALVRVPVGVRCPQPRARSPLDDPAAVPRRA